MIIRFKRRGLPEFEDIYELDIKRHKMPEPTGDVIEISATGEEVDQLLLAIKKLQGSY